MSEASLELLAPRADVWGFLAEPYHLADWWPGITGVEPDLRGFAPGARWKVQRDQAERLHRPAEVETLVLIREIDPYERWAWHLLDPETEVEIPRQVGGRGEHAGDPRDSRGSPAVAVKAALRPRPDGGVVVTADLVPTIVRVSEGVVLVEWNPVERFAGRRG